jgi:hypothetical protein
MVVKYFLNSQGTPEALIKFVSLNLLKLGMEFLFMKQFLNPQGTPEALVKIVGLNLN